MGLSQRVPYTGKEVDTRTTNRQFHTSDQITHRNILRVLLAGFALVILLLVVAGIVAIRNIRSIQANAATLVEEQKENADLIEEIQREQDALSAVFYSLARDPESVDREKILTELKAVNENIDELVTETADTPEEGLGKELGQAALAFSVEARRLLELDNVPTRFPRDLLHRHQQVAAIVAKLVAANQRKSQAAQQVIDHQSRRLVLQSFTLLGACCLLALLFAVLTVKNTTSLFRKMEWQASELSRVSWHMLGNQETTARRFSHELHDELGQSLTALKANLVSLRRPDTPDGRLDDCLELVDGAVRNVREISQLLHPTILDDFGLEPSLRWLAERFTQRTGIEVDYESNFPGRASPENETHLFRIAQEALTNIARHSGATKAKIDLRANGGDVHLLIEDNGGGIQDQDMDSPHGMGMVGMRARARNAGGDFRLRSVPGQGVRIEITVPATSRSHEQEDPHPARG
jgi:signal transduction histidine kinase